MTKRKCAGSIRGTKNKSKPFRLTITRNYERIEVGTYSTREAAEEARYRYWNPIVGVQCSSSWKNGIVRQERERMEEAKIQRKRIVDEWGNLMMQNNYSWNGKPVPNWREMNFYSECYPIVPQS